MTRITYQDVNSLKETFEGMKNSLNPRIDEFRNYVNRFIDDSEIFDGNAAYAMRRYIREVHLEILNAFSLLLFQMDSTLIKYMLTFQSDVDRNDNAVIEVEYLELNKKDIYRLSDDYEEIQKDVSTLTRTYAEFLTIPTPNVMQLQNNLSESSLFLSNSIEKVEIFDTNMSTCLNEVETLLEAIKQACKTNICIRTTGSDFDYPLEYAPNQPWYANFNKRIDYTQYTIEELCALDVSYLSMEQKNECYEEIGKRIILSDKIHVDKEYVEFIIHNPSEIGNVGCVVKYELTMPEDDLNKVNDFMSPLAIEDIIGIKAQAYSAHEPYCDLFIEYLDQFKITSTTVSGVFDSNDNTLVFNVVQDRTNPRGTYYTFFHEVGHAIDYYHGMENGYETYMSDTFVGSSGMNLSDANRLDVKTKISDEIDELFKTNPTFSQWSAVEQASAKQAVVDNLMNYNLDISTLSPDEILLHNKVKRNIKTYLQGNDDNSASDVFGGVTDNEITGTYFHDDDDENGDKYWLNPNGSVKRLTNKESFAHYYGRYMAGEPERTDGLDSINSLLPESEVVIEEIIVEMGEKVK